MSKEQEAVAPDAPSQHDAEKEPEPGIQDLVEPIGDAWRRISRLKAFFRTRAYVAKGGMPSNFSLSDLRDKGLMTAWKFNLFQSALSALPWVALTYAANMFDQNLSIMLKDESAKDPAWLLTNVAFGWIIWGRFDGAMGQGPMALKAAIDALLVPLTLGMSSLFAARALAPKGDKETRRSVRLEYLYFDGTYGLWPQMILAGAAILLSRPLRVAAPDWLNTTVISAVVLVVIWQMWLLLSVFPRQAARTILPSHEVPNWARYIGFTLLGVGIFISLIEVVLYFAAFAVYLVWIQIPGLRG